ncbi:MAG TPA: DUF6011 domain-containing protein [Isosphaeraceae bacterium]|jgi:hypothetical protein
MSTNVSAARTVTVVRRGEPVSVETDITPDEAAAILVDSTGTFVRSLVNAYVDPRSRARMSARQVDWLVFIAAEEVARATRPEPEVIPGELDRLVDLFHAVATRLKYPGITLSTEDGRDVSLKLCGSRSRYAGSIAVSNGKKYGDPAGVFYGYLRPDGRWDERASDAQVTDLLRRLAADPVGVAGEYGRLSGNCCFCRLSLTDERSVAVGYGPICADKWGLPWGSRPAPRQG